MSSRWLCLLMLFTSCQVFADSRCEHVNGAQDMVIEFTVVGSPDYQELYFTQGNKREQTLWYTQDYNSDPDYIFNEQGLQNNQSYRMRIEYQEDAGMAYYYQLDNGNKTLRQSKPANIKNGNLNGTGIGISDLQCSNDEVVTPPEPPEPELPDQCAVFPHAVQSWFTGSSLNVSGGNGSILGTSNGAVGVGSVIRQNWQSACDGQQCVADSSLLIAQPAVQDFNPVGPSINLGWTPAREPIAEGSYTSITLGSGQYELTGLNYDVGSFSFSGGGTLYIKPGTLLKVNQLSIGGSAKIIVEGDGDQTWNIWGEDWNNQSAAISISTDQLSTNIFSRGSAEIHGVTQVLGSVTAKDIAINGSAQISHTEDHCSQPPLPGNDLSLTPNQGIQLTCEAQPIRFEVNNSGGTYNGNIVVTSSGSPNSSLAVIAGQGTSLGGNLYKPNSAGVLGLTLEEPVVGSVSVTGYLENDQANTSVSGSYKFVAHKFGFTPNPTNVIAGKESDEVAVQPLQCLNNAPVVAADYNGVKQVDLLATAYLQPNSTARPNQVIQVNGQATPSSNMPLDFGSNSTATVKVAYAEAGAVSYKMQDTLCLKDADGNDSNECVTFEGEHRVQSRPWTFALCSPIKPNAELKGTAETGDKFAVSGAPFVLDAIPIKYVSGNTSGDVEVSSYCDDLTALANLETKNFYASDAPDASVTLEASLDTPSDGRIGDKGLQGIPDNGIGHDTVIDGRIRFDALQWDEAGSLRIKAKLDQDSNYLFEPIQAGQRSVGRFVPSQLTMLSPDSNWVQWQYATGHTGFAYMSQPITHSFRLQAVGVGGIATQNYGLFDDSLISTVGYVAQTKGSTPEIDFVSEGRIDGVQTWNGASWPKDLANDPSTLAIEMTDFSLLRKTQSGAALTTEVDGPYDTQNGIDFGLKVDTEVDGVNIGALDIPSLIPDSAGDSPMLGKRFNIQPRFRYGRMNLADVGGNSGQTVRVPLRIEYWNGNSFVLSTADTGSRFNSIQRYCSQTIWTNNANIKAVQASLDSSNDQGVVKGESQQLNAVHTPLSGTK